VKAKKFQWIRLTMLLITAELFSVMGMQAQNVDSLENVVKTGTPEMQMKALSQLTTFYQFNDVPKAMEYAWKEKNIADKEKSRTGQATALSDLGDIYYTRKIIDSALYYIKAASVIWEELGDRQKLADSWADMGSMQILLDHPDDAIENNRKALEYYQHAGSEGKAAIALTNIANAYSYMGNNEKSNQYTLQAIAIWEKIGDKIQLGISYYNLSTNCGEKKKEGIEYGEKAIAIFRETGNIYYIGMALIRVCRVVLSSIDEDAPADNKTTTALKKVSAYLSEASTIAEKTQNENMKYEILFSQTYYELVSGNYKKAKSLAENLLAATDTTNKYDMESAHELLIYSLIRTNDSNRAVQYFSKYRPMIEDANQQEWTQKFSEMEVKYETEKKELQITALQKEKRLMTGLSIAGGAVLLLALTAFLFLWRWTVQKRRLAEQQVKQLEQEKQLVATQAVLDGETSERSRLARDLHDGLGSMLTAAKLSLLDMKKGVTLEAADVNRFDAAIGILDQSVQEMRRVAHHLMPDSLSRFGLKSAVSDFCSVLPAVYFTYYGDKSRIDPKLEVMIYRSIHELVNNALKHAGANRIMVQIIQEPDRINFTVQDDGCGFDPSTVVSGMGLQNIRNRIASYNGVIDIYSRPDEGTEINVELPLNPLKGTLPQ